MRTKKDRQERIRLRQRKRITGTTERPRMAVARSLAHISAQVIDDSTGRTVVAASSVEPGLKGTFTGGPTGGNVAGAAALGTVVAERLKAKGITRVVFDRGGYLYHGRIRALADAARKAGLEF
ncbi:MAG: 50S ribosomal protein L18 [Vicinamibacterales bacterium]